MSLQSLPSIAWMSNALDRQRMKHARTWMASDHPGCAEARELCRNGGPQGREAERIDTIATELLHALRQSTRGPASWLDVRVRSNVPEILDGDSVSNEKRHHAMMGLDRINQSIDVYGAWTALIQDAMADLDRPHIHELAAGHAGFSRYLASQGIRVSASDIDPEHIALARSLQGELAMSLDVRDATALKGLENVDLFLCAQAAHHLQPGLLVRMIAESSFRAKRGIMIIDLQRSASLVPLAGLITSIHGRQRILIQDGMQSVRRAYTPSEITLLAHLAGAHRITTQSVGPAHFCVLADRESDARRAD